ncbi:uncharacterized protein LOC126733546 [Anthonomus grandis grandis]|uniref:uncharacterized protein LOC126733546 n=1 Tax=Anthonomus grandis grandis TaxID=2921223 RepID=UPI00216554F3|nr:uncharacterized protein LOC126733546 [Anthonomus grandis grandis]
MEEPAIKDHLESSSVFRGTSSDIQNDLVESITCVVQEIILEELKNTEFVSVQADETTDISCCAQFSVILRYVCKNEIVERFLGFYDVSGDKTAVGLSNKILEVLKLCQVEKKLVSQTYDGASVKIMKFIEDSDKFDPENTNLAIGLIKILKQPKLVLMLCLFYKICFKEVEQTIKNISDLCKDETIASCVDQCDEFLGDAISENIKMNFKTVAFEVIDTIIVQLQERFSDIHKLSFINLFDREKYPDYLKQSPKYLYQKLDSTYPKIFNLLKLENELSVIYACDIKQHLEPLQLFNYIYDNDLNDVFSKSIKLLRLIFTVPVTSASSERSMSTLKRIKTYLRNSMKNEWLPALSTLSIEKDIVGDYNRHPQFKEKIIDNFAMSKSRRIELLYKAI